MRQGLILMASLLCMTHSAQAQERGQVVIDELRTSGKHEKPSDLDTLKLASAHREQSASMAEKTDGLWQSWLVSICQGCGADRHQFSQKDVDEVVARSRSQQANGGGQPAKPRLTYQGRSRPDAKSRTTSRDDLSTGSIETIRQDPNTFD